MFRISSIYNNKEIQHTDEQFEAHHHFVFVTSSKHTQIDGNFCTVPFKKSMGPQQELSLN